jgi:hypothetical protein
MTVIEGTQYKLDRAERVYLVWPFWGLPSDPQISVGGSAYQTMTEVVGYVPDPPLTAAEIPPGETAGSARWFRVLLAGPDATSNPVGTVVCAGFSQLKVRIAGNPEIDVQFPNPRYISITN